MYLHIISFNIPYPPNYGGIIDVYYKIKALHEAGVKIILHCFEYGRTESEELNKICEKVYYYHRDHSLRDFSSLTPYIVKSRKSSLLLDNLLQVDAPILFEGLHTCYFLDEEKLANRLRLVRMHNVEADYYKSLGSIEKNIMRKFYFYTESIKLRYFERILGKASYILPISFNDYEQLKQKYANVEYLAAFHPNEHVSSLTGKGTYCLFHGNLSVNENNQSAVWLVSKVFNNIDTELIVAGSNPSPLLNKLILNSKNVKLVANPSVEQMDELVKNAHIHVLPTFQPTGIKLKLLNALFNGRFVLANPEMVENTGLERICTISETADEMKQMIKMLMGKEFSEAEKATREEILMKGYSNHANAEKLIELLSKSPKS